MFAIWKQWLTLAGQDIASTRDTHQREPHQLFRWKKNPPYWQNFLSLFRLWCLLNSDRDFFVVHEHLSLKTYFFHGNLFVKDPGELTKTIHLIIEFGINEKFEAKLQFPAYFPANINIMSLVFREMWKHPRDQVFLTARQRSKWSYVDKHKLTSDFLLQCMLGLWVHLAASLLLFKDAG